MPAGPQRAPHRRSNTAGRHRATTYHPGRRLTLAAVLAVTTVIAPAAWVADLNGPGARAPVPTAHEAPPLPEPAARVENTFRPAARSRQKKEPRTDRGPSFSRGGANNRAAPTPQPPDWLSGCDTTPAETTEPNGLLSDANLCELPTGGLHLRGDAARAWWRLSEGYQDRFGEPLCTTDAYRTLDAQQRLSAAKPGLAARPGTSNHGWGVAVDLCGGAESFGTAQHVWLKRNADDAGWTNPSWAQRSGSKPEPWHWEYVAGATP